MEIILTQDVKGKGKKGQIIKVKDGYGLNYLVKNNLGVPANEDNLHKLKLDNNKKQREENARIEEAKKQKEKIENLTITFKVNTGKNDQVFGTISTKQIATELEKKGIKVDKKKIILDHQISSLGMHNIQIELHKTIQANLKIELKK